MRLVVGCIAAWCLAGGLAVARAQDERPPEGRPQHFVVHQDLVFDRNAPAGRVDDYLDTTFDVIWPHMHASLTLGSFDMGCEWGGFVRDRRGSAYGLVLRRRTGGRVENTSLQFESLQKLGRTVVGASARMFWPDAAAQGDPFSIVPAASCEVYYGAYSFAAVRLFWDPRPGTGTTLRITNRWAGARRALDLSIAPRTDGALSWGAMVRWGFFAVGLSSEDDYDFTAIDRLLVSFGFHYDL